MNKIVSNIEKNKNFTITENKTIKEALIKIKKIYTNA